MTNSKSGAAIAATVAALFVSGAVLAPTVAHAGDGGVKCMGTNSCKGHSECATATSSCKGQNACKGQGWEKKASKEDCEAAGGKVVMDKG
ncbi:MAG: hypothetical protein KDG52_00335 [Rhodocyclaceae bacterium]|nr:hypothetical protein [Rhodocyclaceae bacterium]